MIREMERHRPDRGSVWVSPPGAAAPFPNAFPFRRAALYTTPAKLCERQNPGLGCVLTRKLAFELLCLR